MHQIRQKKPKPSKRNATSSSIAPTSGARLTSALVQRVPTSALVDRAVRSRRSRREIDDRAARSTIAPRDLVDRTARSTIALRRSRRSSARCDRRRSGVIWALSSLSLSLWSGLSLLSLSLSLSLQKLFEVKMRGETDFWVKGENIGQPEVIFRKMIFSMTAKHAENGENHFHPKQTHP